MMHTLLRFFMVGAMLACLSFTGGAYAAPSKIFRIHYYRVQNDYAGWGLHVWGEGIKLPRRVTWTSPLPPSGVSDKGIHFDLPIADPSRPISFVLHRGDVRQAAGEVQITPATQASEIWLIQDDPRLYPQMPASLQGAESGQPRTLAQIEKILRVEAGQRERIENQLRQDYERKLRQAAEQEYQLALKRIQLEVEGRARATINGTPLPSAAAESAELASDRGSGAERYVWWLFGVLTLSWLAIAAWQQLRITRLYAELRRDESEIGSLQHRLQDAQNDQEQARQQAITLERRLHTVFTQAADTMAVLSVELGDSFRIIAVNRAFCRQTGLPEGDVINRRLDEIISEESSGSEMTRRVREVVRRCEPVQFEERLEFPSGLLLLDTLLTPIQAQPGFCSHVLLSARVKQDNRSPRERWQHYSHFDALTGLANRTQLHQKITHLVQRLQRQHGVAVAVVIVNIDGFRHLNDRFGFEIGDTILQTVAQRMISCVRDTDAVARLGTDEFAILLDEGSTANIAQAVAEKLLANLQRPLPIEGQIIRLAASIGVAVYPEDGTSANNLLKHADAAMRKIKEKGGNAWMPYSSRMKQQGLERLALEANLRRGLLQQEFRLVYQPVISSETGRMAAIEALLRWQHPDFGVILPTQFLPIAESIGCMNTLLEWCLKQLATELPTLWKLDNKMRCALNISLSQYQDPDFLKTMETAVREYHLDPQRITLDINETTLQADMAYSERVLATLIQRGFTIAADDFGLGYAGFSALKQLPINEIKLERGLVNQIPRDNTSVTNVQSMILQAKAMNINVVAKGIEDEAQKAFLQDSGCPCLQGFLISAPIPIDKLAADYRVQQPGNVIALKNLGTS